MVLLVDPHQEVLLVVVPDTTRVGPVTRHVGGEEEGRHRFVEQEVILQFHLT